MLLLMIGEKINKVGGLLRSIFIKMKNAVSISIRHTTGKKPGAEEGSKNRIIRTRKVGKAEIDYKNN